MSALSRPEFHNEEAAFAHLEEVIWGGKPVCPHCGGFDRITKVKANPEKRIRMGLWRCGQCKGQFTVKVGTVFEHARMPLHKMLQAVYLLTSSKKGVSSHQLHRMLEVQYKTAWFLAHRIREAMRDGSLAPFGTTGGCVEVDETYIGRKAGEAGVKKAKATGSAHKLRVVALIDRETGAARSMPANSLVRDEVAQIVRANVAKEAKLTTDESRLYSAVGREFAAHDTVLHGAGIYVQGDVTTNTVEGFFSIFKRGMRGIYQHCGEKHLHRYLAEFDFRYTHRIATGCDDRARGNKALASITGKRLTYRSAGERSAARA